MSDETRVDVWEVMGSDAVEAHCERQRVFGHKRANQAYAESVAAQTAVKELIEASKLLEATLIGRTEWDEGCLYYNGISVPELQEPLKRLDAALSTIRSTL